MVAILLVTLVTSFWESGSGNNITQAHAESNGVATTPFMRWSTWSFDGGYSSLVNQSSGLYADVSRASTTAGAVVIEWSDPDGSNQ